MAVHITRDAAPKLFDVYRAFRARADQAHLAQQYIDQLRQLVQGDAAQELAYAGAAGIVLGGPTWPVLFRVRAHGAELEAPERPGVQPHPFLGIKDRAGRISPDEASNAEQKGRQEHQAQAADDNINGSLDCTPPAAQGHVAHRQQRQPAQVSNAHLAGHDLKDVGKDLDVDRAALALRDEHEDFLVAGLGQGNDHLIYVVLFDQVGQPLWAAHHRRAKRALTAPIGLDHAYDFVTQPGTPLNFLQDHLPHVAGTDDEHPVCAPALRL